MVQTAYHMLPCLFYLISVIRPPFELSQKIKNTTYLYQTCRLLRRQKQCNSQLGGSNLTAISTRMQVISSPPSLGTFPPAAMARFFFISHRCRRSFNDSAGSSRCDCASAAAACCITASVRPKQTFFLFRPIPKFGKNKVAEI